MTKLTAIEIVDETIKYYTKEGNSRAIEDTKCQYNSKDGDHCAIGRCLLPKYQKLGTKLKGNNEELNVLASLHGVKFDKMLQMKYRGQPKALWETLQVFHDTNPYWYKKKHKLTKLGMTQIKELKKVLKKHKI